ncbi:MAG TPA: hypothetical protein VH062_02035 [Polyangiaceae bacterium]|jgi:hypothetical protein|nr:hypothetical protein [Polyangiaceae bacterium]
MKPLRILLAGVLCIVGWIGLAAMALAFAVFDAATGEERARL